MGQFDHVVDNIVARIASQHSEREKDAQSVQATAEKMFGNIGTLAKELQPVLEARFPDMKPKLVLGRWTKGVTGASNTLRLETATRKEDIKLDMTFNHGAVQIDGRAISSHDALNALGEKIARFFSEA